MAKVIKNLDLKRLTDKRFKLRSKRTKLSRRIGKLGAQILELNKEFEANNGSKKNP